MLSPVQDLVALGTGLSSSHASHLYQPTCGQRSN